MLLAVHAAFTAETFDAPGAPANVLFHVRVGELYSSRGNNCFAPSCCNRDYDMDVMDASESVVVGHVANVFPGCNCGGITERSNLVLRFPPNATPKQRAALVASYVPRGVRALRDAQAAKLKTKLPGFRSYVVI